MNKRISFKTSILTIMIAVVFFLSVLGIGKNKYAIDNTFDYPATVYPPCQVHAYEGKAPIRAWFEEGNNLAVSIKKEDLNNLPEDENIKKQKEKYTTIKIVDLSEEMREEIKKASSENPKELIITGFFTSCELPPLACLEYKEGIFKSYLNNQLSKR